MPGIRGGDRRASGQPRRRAKRAAGHGYRDAVRARAHHASGAATANARRAANHRATGDPATSTARPDWTATIAGTGARHHRRGATPAARCRGGSGADTSAGPSGDPADHDPGGEAATVATPTPLTPIPLALPHSATQSAAAKPGGATAKPSATPIISAKLPEPALSSEASPADFLRAARVALATGQNGAARSALEMAQTRLLDRAVDAGKENVPSHDLAVQQISEAISALTANDRMTCLRYIEFASETIGSPLD